MKVLHFIEKFSITSETFVYDQIQGLSTRGVENIVLTNQRINSDTRPFEKVEVIPERPKLLDKLTYRIQRHNAFHLFRPSRFASAIKSVMPNLIHAHFGPNGVRMHHLLTRFSLDIPILTSLHGTDTLYVPYQNPYYRESLKYMSQTKDRWFTVNSDFLAKKAQKVGINASKIIKLLNCFNTNFTQYRKNSFFSPGDPLKIITTGRLVAWKGHEYLINGFAHFVKHSYPNAQLTIVGEGEERESLEALARHLGLEEKIHLVGAVPHQQMPSLLREQDVYVQPSIQDPITNQEETFGIAILEAIAIGLPVVVTRTGGIPEVVGDSDNQFIFTVSPAEELAFANVFKTVASEKYQFMNNQNYFQTIAEKFSVESHLDRLMTIYQDIT